MKVKSWFRDDGVYAALREWTAEYPAGQITAYEAVGTYTTSQKSVFFSLAKPHQKKNCENLYAPPSPPIPPPPPYNASTIRVYTRSA